MAQNIYDTDAFFNNYAQLPRSQHGLAGAPEWPAMQALLPSLAGKQVVDLGCGYGWFCRHARQAGATAVLGIDLSARMLAQAQALTQDDAIHYQRQDLEQLTLPAQAFDVAYSSLTLHYLPELAPFFRTVAQALRPGGTLVVSIEHAIFTCPKRQEWGQDSQGERAWLVNQYQAEGPRYSDWLAKGVKKHHRKLATTLNALIGAGFVLDQLDEWGPTPAQIATTPSLAEEAERPMLALFSAHKNGA